MINTESSVHFNPFMITSYCRKELNRQYERRKKDLFYYSWLMTFLQPIVAKRNIELGLMDYENVPDTHYELGAYFNLHQSLHKTHLVLQIDAKLQDSGHLIDEILTDIESKLKDAGYEFKTHERTITYELRQKIQILGDYPMELYLCVGSLALMKDCKLVPVKEEKHEFTDTKYVLECVDADS